MRDDGCWMTDDRRELIVDRKGKSLLRSLQKLRGLCDTPILFAGKSGRNAIDDCTIHVSRPHLLPSNNLRKIRSKNFLNVDKMHESRKCCVIQWKC